MVKKNGFFYRNGITIVFMALFVLTLVGQAVTGWHQYNEKLKQEHQPPIELNHYFTTGHFLQSTFENWESEFLQMALFVLLTISLRQKGSSESKKLNEKEEVDREPDAAKEDAPWPVHKGGLILLVYKHSLSVALILLFLVSFIVHIYGSLKDYNEQQLFAGQPTESAMQYLLNSRLWFESFQNWQSEFLSVAAIVVLSIYLRQKGSPQSKPVDAPHDETGE
jgi:hypothetical protein